MIQDLEMQILKEQSSDKPLTSEISLCAPITPYTIHT